MRAGALDRRVTIERATITIDPDYGSQIETWGPLVTVSAQVVQQGGREFLAAAMMMAEIRVLFRLRWIEGITVLDRVAYADRLHNIKEVRELGRREGLELMTVAAAL